MSILGAVFALVIHWLLIYYKWKNTFLQRTSTKTILTIWGTLGKCGVQKPENVHSGEPKKRNREKPSEAIFKADFPRVKICKKFVHFYKILRRSERLPVYKDTSFFGAVYICNVHFFGRCCRGVLERSCAERSKERRAKQGERERRFTKVSKQSLDLVQCYFFKVLIISYLIMYMYAVCIYFAYIILIIHWNIVYCGRYFCMQIPIYRSYGSNK